MRHNHQDKSADNGTDNVPVNDPYDDPNSGADILDVDNR
jgi:hypothetical protein